MASKSDIEFYVNESRFKINRSQVLFTNLYLRTDHRKQYKGSNSSRYIGDYMYVDIQTYVLEIHLYGKQEPLIFSEIITPEKTLEECKNILLKIENQLI